MDHDTTRLTLQLDILEREGDLAGEPAIALLCSEFALALNASFFRALSHGDITVGVESRAVPQDGVARYEVTLELAERTPAMTDEQAEELVRREFQRALNGSHFRRVASEDFSVRLAAREHCAAAQPVY